MLALALGLIAALAWGVHDVLVRYVSQRTSITAALVTVLTSGLIFMAPILWLTGAVAPVSGAASGLAVASGVAFAATGIALFNAFAIGPVRVVAPVLGAYPILSVGWAWATGTAVAPGAWLAVGTVIAGIAVVARGQDATGGPRLAAILWAAAASLGFAASLGLGQAAAQGAETGGALLIARTGALITIIAVAVLLRTRLLPERRMIPLLALMGALDALALATVQAAGNVTTPEYAAVAASIFGVITIVLARIFLAEPMRRHQWGGVAMVFGAIAYLGLT